MTVNLQSVNGELIERRPTRKPAGAVCALGGVHHLACILTNAGHGRLYINIRVTTTTIPQAIPATDAAAR
jgi:hypothetical protein